MDKSTWPLYHFTISDGEDVDNSFMSSTYCYRAPDDETATWIGRGMAFINDWCADGTTSKCERVDE